MESPPADPDAAQREAMQRVAQGEIHTFRIVAEALEPRLERFFAQLGVPASDRDDLFQETCLRLYRAADRYDPRRPFLPWALTIARRVMLNWHRARKPTVELDEARCVADTQRPVPETGGADDVWAFARARLPAAACELLWLRYGEDLEPAEIASVTRRTPVHVRVLLHRARAALAAALEHDGTGMRPQGGER
ncbi:MAG TPA: sigma-70 family RNA polymerase sigma factor [Kiritimatiellia bacterium]|nr:sigma-70 family RNA polymerase sigma factor [Kiritimatiellia bacterium]HQQ91325.1 sigma-70 family RNA polymerase sigma factor [Kiritimatiellia bacterium]